MSAVSFLAWFALSGAQLAIRLALPVLVTVLLRVLFPYRAHLKHLKSWAERMGQAIVAAAIRVCGPRFIQLYRHFFSRFFDADLVAEEGEPRFAVQHALAVLAAPCAITSIYLFWKYGEVGMLPRRLAEAATYGDKCFFVLVSMVVTGFLAVIEWDALFLDRRDYLVLGALPVPARIIFSAKAASVLAFLAIFAIDINIAGELTYPAMLMGGDKSYLPFFQKLLAHGATMVIASSFVFLFCMALQGLLMNVLPYRSFRKVGPYVQGVLVFVFVASFLLYPSVAAHLGAITVRDHLVYFLFPPVWFLGLYERLLGHADPIFVQLASTAWRAFAICAAACAVTYVLSYRRLLKAAMEVEEGTETGSWRLAEAFDWLAARTLLRNRREHAIFAFVARTINRSRMHRLILAAFIAVGMSIVVNHLVSGFGPGGRDSIAPGDVTLLLIPLLLTFFILTGMRTVFAYPSQLRANWVFRLTEREDWVSYVGGVRKAMVFLGVVPLLMGMLPFYTVLWGWRTALLHLLFVLAASLILIEGQLFGFRKIPFSCSYAPGKTNLIALFMIYAFVLLIYVYSMAWIEHTLLKQPLQFVEFLLVAAALVAVIRVWSQREGSEEIHLVFDEQCEPAVRELGLSKV